MPLTFAAPLSLVALALLPAIWLFLRISPPLPKKIFFPPLKLIHDLALVRHTPAHTPWWLLLLRMLIVTLLIIAAAGPSWNMVSSMPGSGPVLLLMDNGFSSAHDWQDRLDKAQDLLNATARDNRAIALIGLADPPNDITLSNSAIAQNRLRTIQPRPHVAARELHLEAIKNFLDQHTDATIIWISDRIMLEGQSDFAERLHAIKKNHAVLIHTGPYASALALAGSTNTSQGLEVLIKRADDRAQTHGRLRAMDSKGLPIGESNFTFAEKTLETKALFKLPAELRNYISHIDLIEQTSAGTVTLIDDRQHRHRVGVVSNVRADMQNQPLLAPAHYISRALTPFADLNEPRGPFSEAVNQLINENAHVIMLADIGVINPDMTRKLMGFVEQGGILVRFADPRMANSKDVLTPVRLRQGERRIGGTLSWDEPRKLAPFPPTSPFAGIPTPDEITINRQVLAEPDADLNRRTWATLSDGTPIVTAEHYGSGSIVLIHVTADPSWSNLPLSGTFVDMLRRIVAMSGKNAFNYTPTKTIMSETAAPLRILNGFGSFQDKTAPAQSIIPSASVRASTTHPAGFYGTTDAPFALNVLASQDRLSSIDFTEFQDSMQPLLSRSGIDLRFPTLILALILFMIDTLLSIVMSNEMRMLRIFSHSMLVALFLTTHIVVYPGPAEARTAHSKAAHQSALHTRLAYVMTGNREVDSISHVGLSSLSQELTARTSFEPAEPMGIDIATDELAFYPLIYWPIVADQPIPSEIALQRIDAYMKFGGTVIFDTRDAWSQAGGGTVSPETTRLRQMLADLDIPALEPLPPDHVLTKTFFLIDHLPGRFATGQTWVEALPAPSEGEPQLVRAGDNVSPVIITSNDLAAAWATDNFGAPLFPTVGSATDQHEIATRGGINLVMYVLTGSYKADQVHIPALLQRLEQ